ncbi:hypothetical protein OE88DRAFT_1658322 [Heliocybe sulcata]|uniref:Uncharacterized protein n=1 Tax=Heliocybe sulcata TaxID=5364 RepID=A0A5C3N3E2_9AGAM|nr:hypothetical protein OE88DRAFT_1658322 [Heliocybe sulcata]
MSFNGFEELGTGVGTSSAAHSSGSPPEYDIALEGERAYSLHPLQGGHSQEEFDHLYHHDPAIQQPYHPAPVSASQVYPQSWSDASWNHHWGQYPHSPAAHRFDARASHRQNNLTVQTGILMYPGSMRSPGLEESPSASLPPSSSTLVDATDPFRAKFQSPISPSSTQIYVSAMSPMVIEAGPTQPLETQPITHQDQSRIWKEGQQRIPGVVPQKMYRPQAANDKKRYIDEIRFDLPITFRMTGASEDGISVREALVGHLGELVNKDDEVFINCGPSVSIRINWPGYDAWSKQIPTKNWKSQPGPITRQKLAKQVARRIEEFIKAMYDKEMDEDGQPQWKVGSYGIQLHDLILVSLHQVSKGSWQPQLRLHPSYRRGL